MNMSIKDDMLEEHLNATNTCFVCRKTMNENGECSECNDPSTYEKETVDLIEIILSMDNSYYLSLKLFWLQVFLIQKFDYQLDDFQEVPSKDFYPKYENLEHHIISCKNGLTRDDLEQHIEYLFTIARFYKFVSYRQGISDIQILYSDQVNYRQIDEFRHFKLKVW